MSGQFICFYDRGLSGREKDRVPIGTGTSREEAVRDGLPIGLRLVAEDGVTAVHSGYFTTVEQQFSTADWRAVVDGIHDARAVFA